MGDVSEQGQARKVNVLVGIATGEKNVTTTAFLGFLKLAGTGHALVGAGEGPVTMVRDSLVQAFLQDKDFTHLLQLDADHVHPPDIVERLARWLGGDDPPMVVSALNYQRKPPYRPAAFFFDGPDLGLLTLTEWPQGLVRVDAVGASALLVAREVFEALPAPWFEFHHHETSGGGKRFIGEDIWFSAKCKEAGIPIYVDTTTTCPHVGEMLVGDEQFRKWASEQEPGSLKPSQVQTIGRSQREEVAV